MPNKSHLTSEEISEIIKRTRREKDAMHQPETLERIISAVRKELGEDCSAPAITYGMVMAAGYAEQAAFGGLLSVNIIQQFFVDGAKVHGCQCPKCSKARAQAKASADDVLKKAAGHGG